MTPEVRSFVDKLTEYAASHAAKSAETSNEKLDKLAGLLIQIAFALGALASARIVGHFGDLPYTVLGAVSASLSIVFGASQFVVDYYFFVKLTKGSRTIATALLGVLLHDDSPQAHKKWEEAEAISADLPNSSNTFPLMLQAIFLIISVILIFAELNKMT